MTVVETQADSFEKTWESPRGLAALSEVNGIPLGKRFMATAFVFFLLGGILALLMRIQLAVPNNNFVGPEVFNRLFTMHGSTMMYLFAVPFLEGLAIYLLPLMLGTRDLAFPRLTQFGYWTYLFGGIVFYASFIFGAAPDLGWFAYPPLSGPRFAGIEADFWLMGLSLVEIAGITAGIEIIVTILKFRSPGMSISRLPLFIWAVLTAAVMIVFAFTTLLTATILLELDRALGTHFFDPVYGGSVLLWQHLFWFFGHPEVYIIFLPATGIVSMVVSAFAGRLVGYVLIAVAILVTGFMSFGLWVHHMYTTGLPDMAMNFFASASLMIAIASGVQVFAWIACLWGSRAPLKTPLMYVLGFLFIFVLGGLTGVMVGVVSFDWQVHDTYFVVAHFHYVLIGGAVFPVLAGLHYWLPKITGRVLGERLGQLSFWLSFVGFNVTFFPMHQMGFEGMPRRVYTYVPALNLGVHNFVATVGAFIFAAGTLVFLINLYLSLRGGARAGKNPWRSDSLEWAVSSPPPPYCHARPPVVTSRHPLWVNPRRDEQQEELERVSEALDQRPAGWRGVLTTEVVSAQPQAIQWLPGPTWLPVTVALGLAVGAIGVLVQAYLLLPLGLIFAGIALVAWLQPDDDTVERIREDDVARFSGLPVFSTGTRAAGWWGMVALLATLGTVLGAVLYSYFYIRLFSDRWPQGDLPRPPVWIPLMMYALLPAATVAQWYASRRFHQDRADVAAFCTAGTILAGAAFVLLHLLWQTGLGYGPRANAYASCFFVLSWTLDAFVLIGIGASSSMLYRLVRLPDERDGPLPLQVQLAHMYWWFAAVCAAVVYATLHLSPYVI